jgi:urease subunit alpha
LGLSPTRLGVTFTSQLAIDADRPGKLGVQKKFVPISNTRALGKQHMLHNNALPNIEVDSETFEVRADGVLLSGPPAAHVPLNRSYMLR